MKVFMAMPTYDGQVNVHCARAFYATASRCLPLSYGEVGRSLLANAFNLLWATALGARESEGVTHFAMLHADVIPQDGWLDVLHGELSRTGADLVSAVVPIKDPYGVTSTAIGTKEDSWEPERRLTMHEVFSLPETFSAADAGYPDRPLLVNTGCWLADIRKPAFEGLFFEIRDQVTRQRDETGAHDEYSAWCIPEDWGFSRRLWERGGVALATRKVRLQHCGRYLFNNWRPWGAETDPRAATPGPLPALKATTKSADVTAGPTTQSPAAAVPAAAARGLAPA